MITKFKIFEGIDYKVNDIIYFNHWFYIVFGIDEEKNRYETVRFGEIDQYGEVFYSTRFGVIRLSTTLNYYNKEDLLILFSRIDSEIIKSLKEFDIDILEIFKKYLPEEYEEYMKEKQVKKFKI